jgi:hypothetical protein
VAPHAGGRRSRGKRLETLRGRGEGGPTGTIAGVGAGQAIDNAPQARRIAPAWDAEERLETSREALDVDEVGGELGPPHLGAAWSG